MRRAIYGPNAHIVFPAESNGGQEFEGRLIAEGFTALQGGKETHTNFFNGHFPCSDDPVVEVGRFALVKVVDGAEPNDFPSDTAFTVRASWEVDGEVVEQEFALPVAGSVVAGPQDSPAGSVVTHNEVEVPVSDEFAFTGAEFSSATLKVAGACLAARCGGSLSDGSIADRVLERGERQSPRGPRRSQYALLGREQVPVRVACKVPDWCDRILVQPSLLQSRPRFECCAIVLEAGLRLAPTRSKGEAPVRTSIVRL